MKTKPTQYPVGSSFPTCGEVFEFLINALDLPAWSDFFSSSAVHDKARAKAVSDQLRDWACETDGRVPSRADLLGFVRSRVSTVRIQHDDKLQFILEWLVSTVMDQHTTTVRENATYLDRAETRAWYGRGKAPDAIFLLYQFSKLLLRIPSIGGPMLKDPLGGLLSTLWLPDAPKHPMLKLCFEYYRPTSLAATEADVLAWKEGTTRPHFRSLGNYFRGENRSPEIVINFGFALLIEALAEALRNCVPSRELADATCLLTRQAHCLARLEEQLAAEDSVSARYSLDDYTRYLGHQVARFRKEVVEIVNRGDEMHMDLRCHRDYFESFSRAVPPVGFGAFYEKLSALWNSTRLGEPPDVVMQAEATLASLRRDFATWCEPLVGVLLAVEARLLLVRETSPTLETLLAAVERYREAVGQARYRAGTYTASIIKEALGLAALVQRGKVAEGTRLLDWIKNTLAWWDLVDLGHDFDHEQEAQRVEKAARAFIDGLHPDLRKRWRAAFSLPALDHAYLGGLFGLIEPEAVARLRDPLDKRQKRPLLSAAVGRDQSPLMEAIDRGDLARARELVRGGADLNFINSTGDTCVTKAFACEDYELVLTILRRDEDPISRRVLLRETDKHRRNALELAISHGRVDVLSELAMWRRGRGAVIDLSDERIMGGQTSLFYAVMLAAYHRMSPEEIVDHVARVEPESPAGKLVRALDQNPQLSERLRTVIGHAAERNYPRGAGMGRPDRAPEIISYLIDEAAVEIDATCTNGHTAFSLAVENGMRDIALRLLQAGANVNHRIVGGVTALCFAIRNDDFEMAKLLHEHRADDRIFVEAIGQPIYAMEMSERIRQLFPRRI